MDINSLPPETLTVILAKIDGISLGKCREVCKKWKDIIDEADFIWEEICKKEFRNASGIGRKKSSFDCGWRHLYKNLHMWVNVTKIERNIREFYKFSSHDKSHALDIDYSVLPLKDTRGIVLYDMTSLKHFPAVVPEKSCQKITSNDNVTVILLKSGLLIQRTTANSTFMTEGFFDADDFVLYEEEIFFYKNKHVYVCDLTKANFESILILESDLEIKEMQYFPGPDRLCIFAELGQIAIIGRDCTIRTKCVNCPPQWVMQIKYIQAINDNNYVCYSRNLFQITTDNSQHLYLDFPAITALFFYADFLLIGTRKGEILLYRISSQVYNSKPIFETIAELPYGKTPVHLDVCERKTGPVIVVATFSDIYILEIDFFPNEKNTKTGFPSRKENLYKRLLLLRDRLRLGVPSIQSVA